MGAGQNARGQWQLSTTEVTSDVFRAAMRRLVTAVTVVTAPHQGRPWGMTVSAFTSVCAEPPTVLVCVNEGTVLASAIAANGRFATNMLSQDQVYLSRLCARAGTSKYLDDYCVPEGELPWVCAPVLRDSLVTFDCALCDAQQIGSHLVVFGEVTSVVAPRARQPLLYGQGRYHESVELGHAAMTNGMLAWT